MSDFDRAESKAPEPVGVPAPPAGAFIPPQGKAPLAQPEPFPQPAYPAPRYAEPLAKEAFSQPDRSPAPPWVLPSLVLSAVPLYVAMCAVIQARLDMLDLALRTLGLALGLAGALVAAMLLVALAGRNARKTHART